MDVLKDVWNFPVGGCKKKDDFHVISTIPFFGSASILNDAGIIHIPNSWGSLIFGSGANAIFQVES